MQWHDIDLDHGVLELRGSARLEVELELWWGGGEPTRALWLLSQRRAGTALGRGRGATRTAGRRQTSSPTSQAPQPAGRGFDSRRHTPRAGMALIGARHGTRAQLSGPSLERAAAADVARPAPSNAGRQALPRCGANARTAIGGDARWACRRSYLAALTLCTTRGARSR